jgi:hypothetical protein
MSPRPSVMLGLAIALLSVSAGSCRRKAKTPLEAYQRLTAAVTANDGGALFDALDQETRWNWMSIQKFHRGRWSCQARRSRTVPPRTPPRRCWRPGCASS